MKATVLAEKINIKGKPGKIK
jgi:hypothetical protein